MTRPLAVGMQAAGAERIREAAIRLFKARGYHGTSMRELAQEVKMETASLYYYYPSKQDILVDLLSRTTDTLITGLRQLVDRPGGAAARLQAALRFHVQFHLERRDEAFVSHSELRALTPDNLRRVAAKRGEYEDLVCALLAAGVDEGCFAIADIRLASKAILMMCSGVSDWFGPQGRLDGNTIRDEYTAMVMRMIAARGPRTGS